MDIWLRRCETFDDEAEADLEFRLQFSPDERVSILEATRREWLEKNGRVDEGLREELLECLTRHGVRFVVVGAHALAHHVRPRYTKELDLFIDASHDNAVRIVAALKDFGFGGNWNCSSRFRATRTHSAVGESAEPGRPDDRDRWCYVR